MDDFRRAGRDLHAAGLVSTRGGNLSVRSGQRMVITRTGAALGSLAPEDLVGMPLDETDPRASSDQDVHLAIYRATGALAVVHAHPTSAVVLSFDRDEIVPADHEGKVFVPRVRVVDEREPRAALGEAMAREMAQGARIVVARTHGTYAAGATLEDALAWTTTLELSARILLDLKR